jgi:hypothetical protein
MIGQQEVLNLEVFRQNSLLFRLRASNIFIIYLKNILELRDQQENLDKHLNFFL